MVDVDIVTSKLAELGQRVSRVRRHCPADAEALAEDQDTLDLVSFNLLLAVQACLDIASHLIADEGWEPASTLSSSLARIGEHGVLTKQTVAALRSAARMRNLLAHAYGHVDPVLVHEAAISGLVDLERFAGEVGRWLRQRLEG